MKFTFKDITNNEIYQSAKVLFVIGQYNIFNNIAIDAMKDICKPSRVEITDDTLLKDFGIEESNIVNTLNIVDIDTFSKVIHMASMSGLWFSSINYGFASKKHKDWIMNYIKEPSNNGRLVVYCTEYKDYKSLLRNKLIVNSNYIHMIQLNFPYRNTLETIVKQLFNQKGVNIEQKAIELFIMRMSNSYDDYEEIIDRVVMQSVPMNKDTGEIDSSWKYTITYENALEALKGVENFVLDDFIDKLLIPMGSDKPNLKNKIFKMWAALNEELGPVQLVNKLKFKIDDYIEFRLAINEGLIPIKVRFSVPEAKQRIGESNRISKFSDYAFRRMAITASRTSLRDWEYMKLILSNAGYNNESYEKVMYSLINRSILNEYRLNCDINSYNKPYREIDRLSEIRYEDDK